MDATGCYNPTLYFSGDVSSVNNVALNYYISLYDEQLTEMTKDSYCSLSFFYSSHYSSIKFLIIHLSTYAAFSYEFHPMNLLSFLPHCSPMLLLMVFPYQWTTIFWSVARKSSFLLIDRLAAGELWWIQPLQRPKFPSYVVIGDVEMVVLLSSLCHSSTLKSTQLSVNKANCQTCR